MSLTVVSAGPLTLVQDDGRPGLASQGVGPSGAFDRRAMHQARALVGDAGLGTAVLEALGGGLVLRADAVHTLCVTGAVGPLHVDATPVDHGRPLRLRAGEVLHVGDPVVGLRTYVAVAGGLGVPPTLGSRSTDVLARLGPDPLADGDVLDVGRSRPLPDTRPVPALLTPGTTTVDVVLGPRDDWFTRTALAGLLGTAWTVSARSDRIGVRLDGLPLERAVDGELASEPVVRGSVQVTSAGLPVVLGPDHPVTGGYPVVGVVTADGVDRLAQARPGDTVRFRRHRVG
ncbi:biotin-dependent carboxyltransferase family protein [Aeromicrobium sp.]|uniref:5-oxoprolinase subunit C family protein n=1 Tax=Aeromicrobium sp. TaxID=1871063 RepID=UPI003559C9C7